MIHRLVLYFSNTKGDHVNVTADFIGTVGIDPNSESLLE